MEIDFVIFKKCADLCNMLSNYLHVQTIGAAFGAKKVIVSNKGVTLGIWVCSRQVLVILCYVIVVPDNK